MPKVLPEQKSKLLSYLSSLQCNINKQRSFEYLKQAEKASIHYDKGLSRAGLIHELLCNPICDASPKQRISLAQEAVRCTESVRAQNPISHMVALVFLAGEYASANDFENWKATYEEFSEFALDFVNSCAKPSNEGADVTVYALEMLTDASRLAQKRGDIELRDKFVNSAMEFAKYPGDRPRFLTEKLEFEKYCKSLGLPAISNKSAQSK